MKQTGWLIPCLLVLALLLVGLMLLPLSRMADQTWRQLAETHLQQEANSLGRLLAGDDRFLSQVAGDSERFRYVAERLVDAPASLDGRDDDWPEVDAQRLSIDHLLEIFFPYEAETLTAGLRVGTDQTHVYVHLSVRDDVVVYRDLNSISVHRNDHIQIAGIDETGRFRKFTIAVFQPSAITAREVSPETGRALRESDDVAGRWLATEQGYNLELRMPRQLVARGFSLAIVDVDETLSRDIRYVMGFSHTRDSSVLGELIASPTPLQQLAGVLDRPVRIYDLEGTLLADSFDAAPAFSVQADIRTGDNGPRLGRLQLGGEYGQPLLDRYFLAAIGVLAAGFACLLLVLHGLLRRQVAMTVRAEQSREKSDHYNEYLERMASRLNHELRTPVTVVKSSLEHLDQSVASDRQVYVERALQGVQRLNTILNKMSEARRLEEALDEAEVRRFNLAELVQGCVEGYCTAYADQAIELSVESADVPVTGIPELVSQLFDKVIENAVSFSTGEAIRVRLNIEGERVFLRVMNAGPALEVDDSETLFESMVRHRPPGSEDHLGLGLYVARTIATFHGGELRIANREDSPGVIVTLELPLLRITAKLK